MCVCVLHLSYEPTITPQLAEEREKLTEGLAAASAWMEEDGYSAVAADFNGRVAELNVTAAAILCGFSYNFKKKSC